VIEQLTDMPPGTFGLRASGKLTLADYREGIEPALQEAVATGELRFVFVLTDFDGLEPRAFPEDVKTGLRVWFREHKAWRRFALVTDVEWVAKSMRLFSFATPGEVLVTGLDGLDEAKRWVADNGA
jgi:hypothetical protein